MKTMDPAAWSPYSQQPFSHGNSGSPRSLILPPSTPTEDTVNNYGSANLLLSPCQGLQSMPPRPDTADPTVHPPSLLNSHYDSTLLSPPVRSSKETDSFFGESLYNGICKENQSVIQDYLQSPSMPPRNDNVGCLTSENNNSGFSSQVPPVSFQPKNVEKPSPGPFGVLPHEAVKTRQNQYDRNKDNFVAPISKPPATPFNSGPFGEQQPGVNGVYTTTPLSTHSVFSTDNSSRSPIVNSVTSPNMSNFSSPSDYYSSPKNNFGAYNSLQSPVPQSPSVAQHSYPSSPFANLDSVNHMPNAPPCSPMSGGSYVNKLQDHPGIANQVPQRSSQKSQHSPGNMAGSNNVMCYSTPQQQQQQQQPQGMVHHGHQTSMSKTPDYHSDYNVFSHNHISPVSYSSAYPAIHSAQMACDDPNSRPHMSHPNMSHDNRMQYTHQTSVPPSTMASPSYLQGKASNAHDMMYGSCPSTMQTSQSMHPQQYDDCSSVINPHTNPPVQQQHHNPNSMMPMMVGNGRHYGYQPPDLTDDKNALDIFNSHIDSGVHNPDQSSLSSFLETELPNLDPEVLNSREMRISEPSQPPTLSAMNTDTTNHAATAHSQLPQFHDGKVSEPPTKTTASYSYQPNQDVYRPGNMSYGSAPRRRGRRGRRRKADVNSSDTYCRYQSYKNDRNSMFSNGFQVDRNKFPEYNQGNYSSYQCEEYRRYDCFSNSYPKTYKERLDAYEFHTPCYTPSKYQSLRKKDDKNKMHSFSNVATHKTRMYLSVEEELRFLGELKFPYQDAEERRPHTFRKTRNKDSEGFLQCYKNFLESRKNKPHEDDVSGTSSPTKEHKHAKEHKEKKEPKHQPKLIIKMGRCNNPGEWRLTETHVSPARYSDSEESVLQDSNANASSHKVSGDENGSDSSDSKTKWADTNSAGGSDTLPKSGAKRIFKYSGRFKHKDRVSRHFTNSQTLSAGKASSGEKPPSQKKRRRKAKNSSLIPSKKKHSLSKSAVTDSFPNLQVTIKQEIISDDEITAPPPPPPPPAPILPPPPLPLSSRKLSLRCKREEPVIKMEPQPGPSVKIEPLDVSSDEIDILDDSDSDPAWTPTSRAQKPLESGKSHVTGASVKRRRKKSSSASPFTFKVKKEYPEESSSKPAAKSRSRKKKDKEGTPKAEKKKNGVFVILKSDLGKDKAPIWRVDNVLKILQRFDPCVENGLQVHRNTYTYAAWNDFTEGLYIQAKVNILSRSRVMYLVQYLGVEHESNLNEDLSQLTTVSPLRENFEVYLQTLISQALDPNFLSEITKENDEYFIKNIGIIESVTADKKKLLLKDSCDSELRRCAELYPCVNILPSSNSEDLNCQICGATKGEKLVQFYGPPYDSTTLGSTTESPLSNKTQFNVCAMCSTSVSLYSRLHHQKYNFFIKCRTKVNLVKTDQDMDTHFLLEHCLSDSTWVNMLFHELEEVWKECDRIGIS